MEIYTGTSDTLPPDLLTGLSRYRHKVFVEKLGWQLQSQDGLEADQFDRPDTLYVVTQDDTREITGTARLLPTTRPYLLGEIFPQLLNGLPIPNADDVWELSRFAAVDFKAATTSALGQFSSPTAVGLLKATLTYAAGLGANKLITVSPIGIERLLSRAGFRAHRAGPPMIIDGHPIFACWIDVHESVA